MDDLVKEINKALQDYTNDVTEGLEDAKKDIAKEAVKTLKIESPKLTGDYAKGWRAKKSGSGYIVYNKTNYQLTHLLEYGHAKRNGGRVSGEPHIRPVEQEAVDNFVERAERVIRG